MGIRADDPRDFPELAIVLEEALHQLAGRWVLEGEADLALVAHVGLVVVPAVAVAILSAGFLATSRVGADPPMPALGGSPDRWVEVPRRLVACR